MAKMAIFGYFWHFAKNSHFWQNGPFLALVQDQKWPFWSKLASPILDRFSAKMGPDLSHFGLNLGLDPALRAGWTSSAGPKPAFGGLGPPSSEPVGPEGWSAGSSPRVKPSFGGLTLGSSRSTRRLGPSPPSAVWASSPRGLGLA